MFKSIKVAAAAAVLVLAATGCGVDEGLHARLADPAILEQVARQESARADALQAEASQLQAVAAQEQARADAAGGWARSEQVLAIEWSKRWPMVVALVVLAVAIVGMGGAVSLSRWAWYKSDVVEMPGGLLAFNRWDSVVVVDPHRMIGGVLRIDKVGVLPVLQTSEELAADIAKAAIVGRAVERVGGSSSRAEIAAKVTESLSAAFSHMAGAASPPVVAGGKPGIRLIPLRTNGEKQKADLASEAAELREFITRGATAGFQRVHWAGFKFESTGRRCSQTRWAILVQSLRDVELLDGAALVCDTHEALVRLGYDDAGEQAGEGESAE